MPADPARARPPEPLSAPGRAVDVLVSERARDWPEATALEHGGARLTYGELEAASNRLAHDLRSLGVGPGTIVAIALERSFAMVTGVLATLKAGGAYLPLDTEYPRSRLEFMLEDASPAVVMTQTRLLPGLPAPAVPLVLVDDLPPAAGPDPGPPAGTVGPDDLAYVIYTSGSTGTPKGVLVEHRGVVNLLDVAAVEFAVTPASRVLQFASFSFDAWMVEALMTLTGGATLCLADPEQLASPDGLIALLRDRLISIVTLPPSLLAILPSAELPDLVTVCSAGEACPPEVARRWAAGRRFLNGYGPTEATVAAAYRQGAELPEGARTVPVGRAIAGVALDVVDEQLQPVPDGTPGELLIGGIGVARGYLNRPDLTAARFFTRPGSGGSVHVYRTGDLARRGLDGEIEILGRLDDQVKIHGQRVELGEIEAALRSLPGVADTAVVARADARGQLGLVAYVVPRRPRTHALDGGSKPRSAGGAPSFPGTESLRRRLGERLPRWMVPGPFIVLEALPLTPNGKVDRAALPGIRRPPSPETAGNDAPATPLEAAVLEMCSGLVGAAHLGIDEDLFDLGADSLIAAQVAARLNEAFATRLPLRALFDAPTASSLALLVLADRLGRNDPAAVDGSEPGFAARLHRLSRDKRELLEQRLLAESSPRRLPEPIPRRGANDPSPLSFAQQRLWFLEQWRPGSHAYNASLALRVKGRLDVDALTRALTGVVARHEIVRTTYRSIEGAPVQVAGPARAIELVTVDLRGLAAAQRASAAEMRLRELASLPFDLTADLMMRAALVTLDDDDRLLLVTSHHIACDGWSRAVLFRELAALYDGARGATAAELDELPIQYADFAAWQVRWLSGRRLDDLLVWWRSHLDGAPLALDMPTDRQRPRVQSFTGETFRFDLSASLTREVREFGRGEGATLYMTLMAVFGALLRARTGAPEALIGSPVANRTRVELEGLIGFFANTLVIRSDASGDPSFRTLVTRHRASVLDSIAHQDLPFEKMVEAVAPPRDPSRTPLVQVNFRVQAAPPAALELGGLNVEELEIDAGISRFDFALDLQTRDDGLRGALEYSTDLFDEEWAQGMAEDFTALLADLVAHPDTPLGRLRSYAEITEARERNRSRPERVHVS